MTPLAFVDIETTGLHPTRHAIWEVAVIRRDHSTDGAFHEYQQDWQLPVDLAAADPEALKIGRFYERRWPLSELDEPGLLPRFAREFAAAVAGCHLVGMVVSFDAERLATLLRRFDVEPTWDYHVIDVEALALGFLNGRVGSLNHRPRPPWKSTDLAALLGVNADDYQRHTALGDAYFAQAVFDAVMTG